MFDSINGDAYGSPQSVSAVAQVTIKSPTMAVLNVYDPSLCPAVMKALKESSLDLDARVEGAGVVLVPLPKPSKEGREAVVSTLWLGVLFNIYLSTLIDMIASHMYE
jgi:ribosome recycling factor